MRRLYRRFSMSCRCRDVVREGSVFECLRMLSPTISLLQMRKGHFLPRDRSSISLRTSSKGRHLSGFERACSALRSNSAGCSGVRSGSKSCPSSAKFSQSWLNNSARSSIGSVLACSNNSAALTHQIYLNPCSDQVSAPHPVLLRIAVASDRPKAAEDSRTPRRWRACQSASIPARFWSTAVLCRFRLKPDEFSDAFRHTAA